MVIIAIIQVITEIKMAKVIRTISNNEDENDNIEL